MRYDFSCDHCGSWEEVQCLIEQRNNPRPCKSCGNPLRREYTISPGAGFQPYETYFDEGLGVDITGREQRQYVMKALGVVESGDPVHGGRAYDPKAPHQVGRQAPKGVAFAPKPDPLEALNEQMVTIQEKDGSEHTVKMSELEVL